MAIVIGDIAGQLDALRRLIDKLPKGREIICVGDLIDRGAWSPEVVQYCIDSKFTCLIGNHEDMMIDYYEKTNRYEEGMWLYNGGEATLYAYTERDIDPFPHIAWMKTLPYYVIRDNYFISHAPIIPNIRIDQPGVEAYLMWNRNNPSEIILGQEKMYVQIFGHNSHLGVRYFRHDDDDNTPFYALCIDSSLSEKITAFDPHDQKLYDEPYLSKSGDKQI